MLKYKWSLIIMFFIATANVAIADGGFYGKISFKGCDCAFTTSRVEIWLADGGQRYFYPVNCRYGGIYTTRPQTFPPGRYYLVIIADGQGNCDHGIVQLVYHGSDWQEVNLVVLGPTPTPNGGEGEE